MSNGIETPLKVPSGYDLETARTCSFVVNVVCDMSEQWKTQNKPNPSQFSWAAADSCSITRQRYRVDDWRFAGPSWSSFKPVFATTTEPFAAFAYGPDDHTAFLAFRGSQTDDDFLMDAKTELVPYTPPTDPSLAGIHVERGFYEVFNGLDQGALMAMLSALASSGGRLVVTGHSLGSALATLTVPLAIAAGIPSANILHYNQASPKVGDSDFQAYYNGLGVPTFRLVNTYDAVPKLPSSGAYAHVGTEAPFGADYPTEAERHNPCCSYSYALFHPNAPYNRSMGECMGQPKP
jgi:hypothetical protein